MWCGARDVCGLGVHSEIAEPCRLPLLQGLEIYPQVSHRNSATVTGHAGGGQGRSSEKRFIYSHCPGCRTSACLRLGLMVPAIFSA